MKGFSAVMYDGESCFDSAGASAVVRKTDQLGCNIRGACCSPVPLLSDGSCCYDSNGEVVTQNPKSHPNTNSRPHSDPDPDLNPIPTLIIIKAKTRHSTVNVAWSSTRCFSVSALFVVTNAVLMALARGTRHMAGARVVEKIKYVVSITVSIVSTNKLGENVVHITMKNLIKRNVVSERRAGVARTKIQYLKEQNAARMNMLAK